MSLKSLRSLPGLAVALLLAGGCQSSEAAAPHADAGAMASVQTKDSQAAMTPQKALQELRDGNARFVAGTPRARNRSAEVEATSHGQYPFAVVLSCVDSRLPVEVVCDQGLGDVFSARVAGNVLDEDVLGSMEFACKLSGAKLIAVIGHSNCGAVKGAIDNVQLGNLTALLGKIKPAVDAVPADGQPRTSKNHPLVDAACEANVQLVLKQIRERSPVLREMLDKGEIALVGGMYVLETGKVEFHDH